MLYYPISYTRDILDQINLPTNPFEQVTIIFDQPQFLEMRLLKERNILFNIEICSFDQFLDQQNKLKKLTFMESYAILNDILPDHHNLFSKTSTMTLKKEIIAQFELFNECTSLYINHENIDDYTNEKMTILVDLYQKFIKAIPQDKYFNPYTNITIPKNKVIFLTNKIYHHQAFNYINKLNGQCFIIPYNTYQPFSKYFGQFHQVISHQDELSNRLFSNQKFDCKLDFVMHSIVETTPKREVEAIVSHIYKQLFEKNKYQDFCIYYPSEEYLFLLQTTLEKFNLPYNGHHNFNQSKATIFMQQLKNYIIDSSYEQFFNFMDNYLFKSIQDYQLLSQFKKNYIAYHSIPDFLIKLKLQLDDAIKEIKACTNLNKLATLIIQLLENYIIQEPSLLNLKEKLMNISVEIEDQSDTLLALIIDQFSSNQENQKDQIDAIQLLPIHQPMAKYLDCKFVYALGFNETIVPSQISDTNLLLDRQLKHLNQLSTTSIQNYFQQASLVDLLSYQPDQFVISYCTNSQDAQTLLPSSLFEQIKHNCILIPIDQSTLRIHQKLSHYALMEDQSLTLNQPLLQRYHFYNNQPQNIINFELPNRFSPSSFETYHGCPYKFYMRHLTKINPIKKYQLQSNEIGSLVHYLLEKNYILFNNQINASNELDSTILVTIDQQVNDYLKDNELLQKKCMNPINQFFLETIKEDIITIIQVLKNTMLRSSFSIHCLEQKMIKDFKNFQLKGFVDRIDVCRDYVNIIDYKSSHKEIDLDLLRLGFNIQMLLYLDMIASKQKLKPGGMLYFNTKKKILKATDLVEKVSKDGVVQTSLKDKLLQNYKFSGYVTPDIIRDLDHQEASIHYSYPVKYVKTKDDFSGSVIDEENLNEIIEEVHQLLDDVYQKMISGHIQITPKGSYDKKIDMIVNPCTYCDYKPICRYDIFYNEHDMVTKGDQ